MRYRDGSVLSEPGNRLSRRKSSGFALSVIGLGAGISGVRRPNFELAGGCKAAGTAIQGSIDILISAEYLHVIGCEGNSCSREWSKKEKRTRCMRQADAESTTVTTLRPNDNER